MLAKYELRSSSKRQKSLPPKRTLSKEDLEEAHIRVLAVFVRLALIIHTGAKGLQAVIILL